MALARSPSPQHGREVILCNGAQSETRAQSQRLRRTFIIPPMLPEPRGMSLEELNQEGSFAGSA